MKKLQIGLAILISVPLLVYGTTITTLAPGEIEAILFNNLYTQTAYFDDQSQKIDLNHRSTYFTSSLSLLVGVASSVSAGADLFLKSVRNEDLPSSPFSVFRFANTQNSRTALSSIALKIRTPVPLGFASPSIQTALSLPLHADLEEQPYLAGKDIEWWTKLLYDQELSTQFRIYAESGHGFRFDDDMIVYTSPFKGIFSYLPTEAWTLYVPLGISPTWSKSGWSKYYSDPGIGIKYLVRDGLELEALVTQFLFGKASGAGTTFNIGFRWVR